jgi:hypothetical protein
MQPPNVAEIVTTEPIVLVEWFDDHWYKVVKDGATHWLASVTTKLGIIDKPGLARWRGDIGNREADLRMHSQGDRGKRIHFAWATALEGGAVIYDPWQNPVYTPEGIAELSKKYNGKVAVIRTQDEMWQIDKLRRQHEILKPKVVAVEVKVYDLETKDAGTIDSVIMLETGIYPGINGVKPVPINKGLYINDLKSGNWLGDEADYQTGKYMVMYEKLFNVECAGTIITHTAASTKKGIPGLGTYVRTREQVLKEDVPMYNRIAAVWDAKHKDDQPETFQFPSIITLGGAA